MKNRILLYLLLSVACAVVVSSFYFDHATFQDIDNRLSLPSMGHPFGTDALGRDLFFRVCLGYAISSLLVIIVTTAILILGLFFGVLASYLGGLKYIILNICDAILIFPPLLLAMVLALLFGRGLTAILISLIFVYIAISIRNICYITDHLRQKTYYIAATALGMSQYQLIRRYVLPEVWPQTVLFVATLVPGIILTESFLSFLGLGIQPPIASLGSLVHEGWKGLHSYPHLMFFPALALIGLSYGIQYWSERITISK